MRRNVRQSSQVIVLGLVCFLPMMLSAQAEKKSASPARVAKAFATPQDAANALFAAAQEFDGNALEEIFGTAGKKIVLSGEAGNDRELAKKFAELAREKNEVTIDPKNKRKAIVTVGKDDWPFAAPLIRSKAGWRFDAKAGEQEILYRRVGRNELDAIQLCHGYVEAQHEYALKRREGYEVNQYAQRVISTPGTQDGLAWQNADGTWDGPIGKNVAKALEAGHLLGEPYNGYYFKVLKGQGPAAPLGQMDFVIKGAMIGGFALVATPAEYGVTGIKTFLVGNDGVVYERDFGKDSLKVFRAMERYNPDPKWTPVVEP